ncbi:DinB/UmuC family translesion DNA polymerase, partial [Pseudomonas aeruginosa]
IKAEISKNAKRVAALLQDHKKLGKTIVLKVRYADFTTLTKRVTLPELTRNAAQIEQVAVDIFDSLSENPAGIRLLGVTMTNLEDKVADISLDL